MKQIVIPITILLLFVHSSAAIFAQNTDDQSQPLPTGNVQNTDENMNDRPGQGGPNENSKNDENITPSPTISVTPTPSEDPVQLSPTPTPEVVIQIPPIALPIIGGPDDKENKLRT